MLPTVELSRLFIFFGFVIIVVIVMIMIISITLYHYVCTICDIIHYMYITLVLSCSLTEPTELESTERSTSFIG